MNDTTPTVSEIDSITPLILSEAEPMLSGRQASQRLGCCRQTFRKLVKERQIGFVLVGDRKKFPESEVSAFIQRNFVARLDAKRPQQIEFDGQLAASAGAPATPETITADIVPNWKRLQDQKKAEQDGTANAAGNTSGNPGTAEESQQEKEAQSGHATSTGLSGPAGGTEPGEPGGFIANLPGFSPSDFTR